MSHQLVAFLGRRIKRYGIVHLVIGRIWNFLIRTIDTRTAGIDQVVYTVVAASLQNIVEADEVAFYICVGIGD